MLSQFTRAEVIQLGVFAWLAMITGITGLAVVMPLRCAACHGRLRRCTCGVSRCTICQPFHDLGHR